LRNVVVALALTLTLTAIEVGVTTARSASAASSDYSTGYSLGQQAYEYGRPLLDTEQVFQTATSIDVSDTAGNGPVNQFNSLAWLDLPMSLRSFTCQRDRILFPRSELSQSDAHAHR
jgi:hypothetical protein